MGRFVVALLLIPLHTANSQWSEGIRIDTTENLFQGVPMVAIGPERQITIFCSNDSSGWYGTFLYTSTDGGTGFTREGAYQFPNPIYSTAYWPLGLFFDLAGNNILCLARYTGDEYVSWTTFLVTRSTNQGRTFQLLWSADQSCNLGGSILSPCRAQLDINQRVHLIRDACVDTISPNTYAFYHTIIPLLAPDQSSNSLLPFFSHDVGSAEISSVFHGNNSDYASESISPDSALYYWRSSDGDTSFSPRSEVDGLNASAPLLSTLHDGRILLAYGSSNDMVSDSALMARFIADSGLGTAFRIGPRSAAYRTTKQIVSDSSKDYLTYVSTDPELGVAYYEFQNVLQPATDSAFFTLNSSPSLAVDNLGGKYLVTLFNNQVYLRTKDVVASVEAGKSEIGEEYQLFQNYPNPFNPTTDIRFSIPQSGTRSHPSETDGQIWVKLGVFDLLGREVATLVDETLAPGTYTRQWDASGMASGVYFYQLRAGSFTETKRLILLR